MHLCYAVIGMTEVTSIPSSIREALEAGATVEWGRPGAHFHQVVECDGTEERFLLRLQGTLDYLLSLRRTCVGSPGNEASIHLRHSSLPDRFLADPSAWLVSFRAFVFCLRH